MRKRRTHVASNAIIYPGALWTTFASSRKIWSRQRCALAVKVDALDHKVEAFRKAVNAKSDSLRSEMNCRFDYLETFFHLDEPFSVLEEERRKERSKQ